MVAILISVVLLPLLFVPSDADTQTSQTVLLRVIDAIERLISFYKTNYNDLNLDGFFGLKVIEGQIQNILQEHERGHHTRLSLAIIRRLQILLEDVHWVSEHGITAVRADDESYFNKLGYIIAQPWNLFKGPRKVVPALRWDVTAYRSSETRKLDEQHSDKCMMEITMPAKGRDQGREDAGRGRGPTERCSLSHSCGLLMTRRGLTDYSITHQLLWTALAEMAGCDAEMNKMMWTLGFNSTEHMQQEFCTNNYFEMLTSVHILMSGKITPDFQDLFMEQQFVCPSLGFFEFLRKDYLDQILSWQLPSGCFGEPLKPDLSASQSHQGALKSFLPPEKVHGVLRPPKGLPSISRLDLKKEEMEQQLKNLQLLDNIGLGPEPHPADLQRDQMARLQEQFQHLQQGPRDTAEAWKQAALQQQQRLHQQPQQQQPVLGERGVPKYPLVSVQQQQRLRQQPQQHQQQPVLLGERGIPKYQLVSVQQLQQSPQRRAPWNQSQLQKSVNGVNMLQQGHQSLFKNGPPELSASAVRMGVVDGLQGSLPVQLQKGLDNNPLGVQQRLLDSVPGRHQETFYNKLQGNPPVRSHGSFPDLPEMFPPKKFPDNLHGVASGPQNMQNNAVNMPLHPEILSDQRVAPDNLVQRPPQVLVQVEGTRQPFPPARGSVIRDQPHQPAFSSQETGRGSQRRLLVEKDMPGGCLSHKTGVAGGALTMYLRYLISPPPLDTFYSVDTHKGFLGTGSSYDKIVQFLGQSLEKEMNLLAENEGTNEEREEAAEANEDVEGREGQEEEEVYPDAMEVARQQEKKVIHFGANTGDLVPGHADRELYSDPKETRKETYVEEEEEGPDYIKRFEGADDKPADAKNHNMEDTEYTYYEEGDNSRGVTRKHKALPAQLQTPAAAVVSLGGHKTQEPPHVENGPTLEHKDSLPPTKALVVLISATSLILILLACKFLRKRRIYLKYGSRAFLRL